MFESALCYGLITFANKHLPATVVTAFWPVQVPVAVVLASCPVGIFAKESDSDGSGSDAVGPFCETLTTMELLGGVLIALGLISVTVADNMERKETEALKSSGLGKALLGVHTQHTRTRTVAECSMVIRLSTQSVVRLR